jgi:hypothetical protein
LLAAMLAFVQCRSPTVRSCGECGGAIAMTLPSGRAYLALGYTEMCMDIDVV